MDNNIKELIEAVLSDQMDEDATISHKHTNITLFLVKSDEFINNSIL